MARSQAPIVPKSERYNPLEDMGGRPNLTTPLRREASLAEWPAG